MESSVYVLRALPIYIPHVGPAGKAQEEPVTRGNSLWYHDLLSACLNATFQHELFFFRSFICHERQSICEFWLGRVPLTKFYYIFSLRLLITLLKKIRRIHTNSPHCPKKCACVPGPQVALVIVTDMLWRQWTGRKSNQQHHDKHRTGKPPNCFEKPTNIHEETTAWHASRSTKESCWFWLRSANFERQGLENEN